MPTPVTTSHGCWATCGSRRSWGGSTAGTASTMSATRSRSPLISCSTSTTDSQPHLRDDVPRMHFSQHYLSCLSHASYIIGDETTGSAAVIDPQRDVSDYLDEAREAGLTIDYVI